MFSAPYLHLSGVFVNEFIFIRLGSWLTNHLHFDKRCIKVYSTSE